MMLTVLLAQSLVKEASASWVPRNLAFFWRILLIWFWVFFSLELEAVCLTDSLKFGSDLR